MCEFNYLTELAHESAKEKGFWDDFDNMINKMKNLPKHFTDNDIDRIKLAFFNEKISLITSELGEATNSIRIDKRSQLNEENIKVLLNLLKEDNGEIKFKGSYLTHVKDTFEDEIANAMIRLLDLCYKMGIDIERYILLKMEYNKLRSTKHGKRF